MLRSRHTFASAFVLSTISIVLPASLAHAQGTQSLVNTGQDSAGDRFQSRAERLKAQPLDWNVTRGTPSKARVPLPSGATSGPPGASDGGRPHPDNLGRAKRAYPEEWKALERSAAEDAGSGDVNFGTVDTYTQYCENCGAINYNWPQIAIGKLFSNSGTCSASSVSANNIIVTAAHCCFNRSTNSWVGGWSFAPAYRDGAAPYGTFSWTKATILTRWRTVGDRFSDVCLINVGNNSSGQSLTSQVGWLGRSWNWSPKQVHHAVGYPGNIGDGAKKELCVSESFSATAACGGAAILNTGCSMTYGASGGPWIRHYRNGQWVNSVVSGYDDQTCTGTFGSTLNGPRFVSGNIVTLCDRAGC